MGALYLDIQRGKISRVEFDREFSGCRLDGALTPAAHGDDPTVA